MKARNDRNNPQVEDDSDEPLASVKARNDLLKDSSSDEALIDAKARAIKMSTTTSQTPSATPETTQPKLLKKASTNDVKSDAQTVYGCSHIKAMLTAARGPALKQYQKLIDMLQNEDNINWAFYKDANNVSRSTGAPTYLCLQCPNISASKEQPHKKDHQFGETYLRYE